MRPVLALETTAAACSTAVWREGAIVAARSRTMQHGHAVTLLPMVQEAMAAAGLDYGGLGAVAVCVGPGSFTGVRVGVAAARAIALAAGIPAVGVSAFEAVYAAVPGDALQTRALAVILDSRRRDLFVQCFAADARPLHEPRAAAPETLSRLVPPGPLLVVGNAAVRGCAALAGGDRDIVRLDDPSGPDACGVAAVAVARRGTASPPVPLYLRAPDARLPDQRP